MTKAPTQPEYTHHAQKCKAFMSRVNPVLLSINELCELNSRPSFLPTCNSQLNIPQNINQWPAIYSYTLFNWFCSGRILMTKLASQLMYIFTHITIISIIIAKIVKYVLSTIYGNSYIPDHTSSIQQKLSTSYVYVLYS